MELVKVTEEMIMEQGGKSVGGDSDHWIYLTNLKAYNEGFSLGIVYICPFHLMKKTWHKLIKRFVWEVSL